MPVLTIALTNFTDEEPEAQGEFTEPLLAVASGRAWDSDEVSLTEPRPLTFQVFRMLLSSPAHLAHGECLGNPMDRRAWQTAVCGVTKKSDTT